MSILNFITNKELLYDSMIKELSNSDLPIIFYGTSDAAKKFYKVFKDNSLNIDEVIVSSEYYIDNSYFFDYKVANVDKIFEKDNLKQLSQKRNIVVFFGINDELLEKINSSKKIDKIFLIDGGVCFLTHFSYQYIKDKEKEFTNTYNLLEDELSKNTMIGFINSRISGYADFIRKYTIPESYFPKDIIFLQDNEVFLDCGAFDGDTIEIFKEKMKISNKSYEKIYGFEPDQSNFKKLQLNCSNDDKVIPINKGVYKHKDTLSFCSDQGGGSCVQDMGDSNIKVDKIDKLISIDDKVTLIKMDLEGVELEALEGAKDTIVKYRPRLAIAVYHKIDDLIQIPKYIKSLVPEYKFYLRAQCYDTVDMTLFAIVK